MDTKHILSEIKQRKIIFYPVTKDDLFTLSEKNLYGDVCSLIASLSLTVCLTCFLTNRINPNIEHDLNLTLNWLVGISLFIFLITLVLAIFFKLNHGKKIHEIIGEKPHQYSIKSIGQESNPSYYIGDRKIVMNIPVNQKERFYDLFNNKKEFKSLKTRSQTNTIKTNHFSFIINNGNDKLYSYFQQFLKDNGIDYIDYK